MGSTKTPANPDLTGTKVENLFQRTSENCERERERMECNRVKAHF